MNIIHHLERQIKFSRETFGPGYSTARILDHIRKELREIEAEPLELEEWVDVILLAFDGAWRSGASPAMIAAAIDNKMSKNERRSWPDWRQADPQKAIEHKRSDAVGAREPYKRDGGPKDLPAGKTCADCVHCYRCCTIFGHIPADERCDWLPVRFMAKQQVNK